MYDTNSMLDRIKSTNLNSKDMNQIAHEIIDIIEKDAEDREKYFNEKHYQPSDFK